MQKQALFISLCMGAAILIFIIFLTAMQYSKSNKHSVYGKNNPDDWLFHNFYLKVYSAFFGIKEPEDVAIKLGINIEKYYKNCQLTRTRPNAKKLIVNTIYGFAAFLVSIMLSLLVSPVFAVLGAFLFFYLVFFEQQRLNSKAEEMKEQVAAEIPRFLDILQTELIVGLPIETSIYIICEKFDSLISREFLEALNEMELGISGWQQALEKVAAKYDIETLSDFVLDVSTSYMKGVSITDSVVRKTKEVKDTHLLNIKEKAGKATNTMLIPMAIFQFIPLFVLIMFPTMIQIFNAF